ncbi:MAG TPA: contractile injection system protein, VgrG/Pvc8 family [Pyrinomonadaceae bacterium]|nr:contractile injection system protein, VgrG/Pvc8 family [Pyrinomonadaceae bacterium]
MTKTITQLESEHRNFYAPAYKVVVNGQNLLTDLFMEIASVQVDNTLKGADRFTFTVNSTFDFQYREFTHLADIFAFGNSVEIYLGYQDISSLTLLHRGMVTAVQTSFPASGLPQINVSGYDLTYCMTKGKRSRNWEKKKDSDVVAEVAREYGLNPVTDDTLVEHPKIEQSQESDYQFLEKLAERNGYELYAFDRELYFRPPASGEAAVVTLEWGKGLVSFAPEINISEQVSKVEVRGWDVMEKKEIVGVAGQGDEQGRETSRRSGAEFVKTICRDGGELKVRVPVYSKQEAERRAEAILKRRSELLVQGGGESIGLPEILADTNVELKGLGKLFSKTYYVEQSTHTVSTSGYRTTFKVKDTTV